MCYSAEVSLGTFLFVEIIAIYLWNRNRRIDRPMALILSILVFMQFLEYLIWINQECNAMNKAVTSLIPYYLLLQPVLISMILYTLKAGNGSLYPLIIATSIPILLLSTQLPNRGDCIKAGECGHLDWNFAEGGIMKVPISTSIVVIWYFFALFYTAATLKGELAPFVTALLAVSLFVSSVYYNRVWSSMWCHSINAISVVALLV
jgi:hypothetical protein